MAMEMHKLFWYVLMEKLMRTEDYKTVLFWANDSSPHIDLSQIDTRHGVFIKIADRSDGGGKDVYYAKDNHEVEKLLCKLRKQYTSSTEQYRKHIFIIEPAYLTLKSFQGKKYNVTGRAFITLHFDSRTKSLEVKTAAAKWMFPTQSLQNFVTETQMFSNIKHSRGC